MREIEDLGFGYTIVSGAGERLALHLDDVIVYGVDKCIVPRQEVIWALRQAAHYHQRYRNYQHRESKAVRAKRISDAIELSVEKRQARDMYYASTRAALGIKPGSKRRERVA